MATSTTNKSLTLPANGEDPNTWDVPVNGNFTDLDTALGGYTTLTVTGASGTVTLTRTQYLPPTFVVTGTLTADVNYQLPSGIGGSWNVINTATGAHTVTFSSAGGGTTTTVPQNVPVGIFCQNGNVRRTNGALLTDGSSTATAAIPFAAGLTLAGGSSVLNRYEVGTWSPTLIFAVPGDLSVSYTTQSGLYTVIGDLCYVSAFLVATLTFTTASGQLEIRGLPVTANGTSNPLGSAALASQSFARWSGSLTSALASTTSIRILQSIPAQNALPVSATNCTSGQSHTLLASAFYKI